MRNSISFGKVSFNTLQLAVEGSAVLGIRGSGKSYTAMLLAEKLFDAGVPFVAFDPVGVWRFLRVPGSGKGYPIVVAGGQAGDLPLTPASAPKIVEAAMQKGVSLVIDLFDVNLSKASWRQIVRESVRVLLHRNAEHGLRHVFIEEAAEFIPQKVADGLLYAEMEKLARMGGNSRLGYTLINQRAEEVNKAVLELCDNLFLHRQKGRNSLTALSKWLDIGNVADSKSIIESMATLPTGQCWVWKAQTDAPVLVKVPHKNSFHPDRSQMRSPAKVGKGKLATQAVDVSSFVAKLTETLPQIEQEAADNDPARLRAQIADLKRQLKAQGKTPPAPAVDVKAIERTAYARGLAAVKDALRPISNQLAGLIDAVPKEPVRAKAVPAAVARPAKIAAPTNGSVGDESLSRPQQRILDAVAWMNSIGVAEPSKDVVAFLAGASSTSGGYFNNLGRLRAAGFIDYPAGGLVKLTDAGQQRANHPDATPTREELHNAIRAKLPAPMIRILDALIKDYPGATSKEQLAVEIGVSPTSGGYFNNLGRLRTLGLIDYPSPGAVAATKVLFPDGLS